MPFHFPLFLGATGPGDPPHSAATLLGVSQVMMELHSCCFEPLLEAFRATPSLNGAHRAVGEAPQSSGTGTSPSFCLRLAAFCALLLVGTD